MLSMIFDPGIGEVAMLAAQVSEGCAQSMTCVGMHL